MKNLAITLTMILMTASGLLGATPSSFTEEGKKGPVVIEVETNHATVKEALNTTKRVLLTHKFILQGQIQESSFTAKRTTGAEADYYIADVMVERSGETNKITITFMKIGTGLLKLSKVADKVKSELEKK